jgi:hypothetical protein
VARKTVAKGAATVAIAPELLERLLSSYEVRSVDGDPLAVFSLGYNKADSPMCIYDHRPDVCRAAARFEQDQNRDTAQLLIDAFTSDAVVKIVTSRIGAVDRPAINLHPVADSCTIDHVLAGTLQKSPVELPEFDKWSVKFPAGRKGKICFRLSELPPPSESDSAEAHPEEPEPIEEEEDVNALLGFRKVVFDRGRPRRS